MAIVCEEKEGAEYLRDLADKACGVIANQHMQRSKTVEDKKILTSGDDPLLLSTEEYEGLEKFKLVGILTLENVIERIMQVDIYDENDREKIRTHMDQLKKKRLTYQASHPRF